MDQARKEKSLTPAAWVIAALLWILPLVAMQFTSEINWTPFDFTVWGIMLATATAAYEIATRLVDTRVYRAVAGLAIIAAFVLAWASLID